MANSDAPALGLSSKDFSSFSTNQGKIETHVAKNESSKRNRITELLTTTEEHLNTANSVIQNAATVTETFKITKQVVGILLAPAKDLVDLLSAVSDVHPAIQVVAGVFKVLCHPLLPNTAPLIHPWPMQAIIKLEMDRQENDRQIAVLYNSMSNMLIVLAYLDDLFTRKDGLHHLLDKKLEEIVSLINEFGNFCDVYYKHRSVVRFLRSAKYKEMLAGFAQSFADMRRELESLVSQRTAMTVHRTADTVDTVAANMSQLVAFMEIHTSKEREAEALVKSKGGLEAVLKDDKLLAEVAQKLGDQVNASVQYTLRQDLTQQLKDNHALFNIKMQAVQEQITETVNRSTMTILMTLDAGPHELIHDPDIKLIWKGTFGTAKEGYTYKCKWRNTVKCRNFVSAVHHHFEQLFIRHAHQHKSPHPDLWTLNYLSKVIFYPAIGDAIDEGTLDRRPASKLFLTTPLDSSGYVSLHELNNFFDSRPRDWTIPQWIAYWAAGWYRDNLRYRDKIMSRLRFLEGTVETMHAENKEVLKEFVGSVKWGIERIVESLYNDSLDYFDDDSAETTKLDTLRDKYTDLVTKEVEEQLAKSKYELDDKRILMLVIGNSRLESRLLCVMHRLLKRHHKVLEIGRDKPLQPGATVAMSNSWQVVFDAFVRRMRSLTESWRQQRMDIALQAQWYANGLFEDWYKIEQAEPESEEEYDDLSDDDDEVGTEQDENELVEYATRPSTAIDTDGGSVRGEVQHREEDENEESEHGEGDREDEGGEVEVGREESIYAATDKHRVSETDSEEHVPEDENRNLGIAHSSVRLPELEARMLRLEEKVDDLKDLMMRILHQLED
ncbi:hypothetical protein FRC10_008027 [Ceratobasidium sp. 414]|nr:hypothetical protein FRC10_008027 [Ceratobasidium sp. 414]